MVVVDCVEQCGDSRAEECLVYELELVLFVWDGVDVKCPVCYLVGARGKVIVCYCGVGTLTF